MALSKTERAAYEQTISHLRDEILWLRAFVRPESAVSYSQPKILIPGNQTDPVEWPHYWSQQEGPDLAPKKVISDDEEAVREMLENDEIDTTEAEALLEAIGAQNTTIEFAS